MVKIKNTGGRPRIIGRNGINCTFRLAKRDRDTIAKAARKLGVNKSEALRAIIRGES